MTATLDSVANILKEYYDDTDVESMLLEDSPTLAIIPKRTDFGGSVMPLPFMFSPTAGIGTTFAAAQASKADASEEKWDITTHDLFSLFSLDHKAVTMAKGNAKSFVDLVESRADAAIIAAKKMYNRYIFGSGSGALAQIQSNDGTTLTLTERAAMHVFDRNMQITSATTDSLTATDLADIEVIANVNRQARTLTSQSGSWDAVNYAANNYVYLRQAVGNVFRGFAGWMPSTAPSSTAWFGVNRTQDSRMYGVIRDANLGVDANLEELLLAASSDIADQGGMPKYCIMNTRARKQLIAQLGSKVEYSRVPAVKSDGDNHATIGFRAVMIEGDAGPIEVIGDRNCPYSRYYMIDPKGVALMSAGPLIGFLHYEDDSSDFLRHGAENAMEARMGGYAQFTMRAPGFSGTGSCTGLLAAEV